MKIQTKITIYITVGFIIIFAFIYWLIISNNMIMLKISGNQAVTEADGIISGIDREIDRRIDDVSFHGQSLALVREIENSNKKFENLTDLQTYINQQDQIWISSKEDEITSFMSEILNNDGSKRLEQIMEFYKTDRNYTVFSEIFVTNKYGAIVSMTSKTSDYRQDTEDWWQKAKSEGVYVSEVDYEENKIDIASKIVDENGEFIGVILEGLDFNEIKHIIEHSQDYITDNDTHNSRPEVKIIDNAGKVIYQSKNTVYQIDSISNSTLFKKINSSISGYVVGEKEWCGEKEEEDKKDRAVFFAYSTSKGFHNFKGFDWKVISQYDEDKLFAEAISLKDQFVIYSFIFVIIMITLVFFVTSSFSKRILYLKDMTSKIGEGNLEMQPKISSKDEIGDLAESIDNMRLGLKDRNDLLNSLLNTFKGKFGNLAIILVRKDINELISKNPRIEKILPRSLETSLKKAKTIKKRQ